MEAGSAAAESLRESFGDRKPIDISRKITACVACRKQKIKCHMSEGNPPCTRCKKRGLSCTVNRSLQMLLEGHVTWKANVEQKLQILEDSIHKLSQKGSDSVTKGLFSTHLQKPSPQITGMVSSTSNQTVVNGVVSVATGSTQDSEQGWEIVMDLNRGPGVIPASCVSEVSGSSPTTARQSQSEELDIVDRGIITLVDAEAFFHLYHQRLDHFLYRILAEHDSLASVRRSSPLLTAAICAVAALHTPSPQYQACYAHFVQLASYRMFSKTNSHDDVRALCIGAFWISDISWTLVGTASRLAGELNLHRCIPKAPHIKKDCYLRTRLYYLVFVCDHHFSIAYGRPPLTRDFGAITPPTEFLRSEFATEDDARLVSQVEIWAINTRIFDEFSLDPEAHLSDRLIPQLRRLSIALDTWRADWNERFKMSKNVGNYPRKGVGLHYHFAKLFLCSHVFRRTPSVDGQLLQLNPELKEFATMAIHAANSILEAITTDEEIQSYFHGLPAYFDTMIAFAFVFLLKMTIKPPSNVWIDKTSVLDTLEKLVRVLKTMTAGMHPRHLLTSIASSMRKLLDRSFQATNLQGNLQALPLDNPGLPTSQDAANFDLSPADATFLENYDFLYSLDGDLSFDLDFSPVQQI